MKIERNNTRSILLGLLLLLLLKKNVKKLLGSLRCSSPNNKSSTEQGFRTREQGYRYGDTILSGKEGRAQSLNRTKINKLYGNMRNCRLNHIKLEHFSREVGGTFTKAPLRKYLYSYNENIVQWCQFTWILKFLYYIYNAVRDKLQVVGGGENIHLIRKVNQILTSKLH